MAEGKQLQWSDIPNGERVKFVIGKILCGELSLSGASVSNKYKTVLAMICIIRHYQAKNSLLSSDFILKEMVKLYNNHSMSFKLTKALISLIEETYGDFLPILDERSSLRVALTVFPVPSIDGFRKELNSAIKVRLAKVRDEEKRIDSKKLKALIEIERSRELEENRLDSYKLKTLDEVQHSIGKLYTKRELETDYRHFKKDFVENFNKQQVYAVLSHRVRLNPNNRQETLIRKSIGAYRLAYNYGIKEWKRLRDAGESCNLTIISKSFYEKKAEMYPFIDELPSAPINVAFHNLSLALKDFFDKSKSFPSLKKRNNDGNITLYDHINIIENENGNQRLHLPKIGEIRMMERLRFEGNIKKVVVKQRSGYFYATFFVEISKATYLETHQQHKPSNIPVGIDFGMIYSMILSNGLKICGCDLSEPYRKLRKINRQLALRRWNKSRKGRNVGETSNKARLLFNKRSSLTQHISNIRYDYLHKLTTVISSTFRYIGLETLNVKSMLTRRGSFSGRVFSSAFYEMRAMIEYKVGLRGGEVVLAQRFEPTTRRCSCCGAIMPKLSLTQRTFVCKDCGVILDRDLNAAYNLRDIIGRGTSELTPVDFRRLLIDLERNGIATKKDEAGSQQPSV